MYWTVLWHQIVFHSLSLLFEGYINPTFIYVKNYVFYYYVCVTSINKVMSMYTYAYFKNQRQYWLFLYLHWKGRKDEGKEDIG